MQAPHMERPRLLFLAHLLPYPLDGGGQIKSYHTLQGLAPFFDIRLIAFIRRLEEAENAKHLLPLCAGGVETVLLPRTQVSNAAAALTTLLSGQSFIVQRDDAPAMRQLLTKELALPGSYHLLWVDHLQMAQFVPQSTGKTKVVLDEHNIEFRIPQRMAESGGGLAAWYASTEWPRLRRFEREALCRADLTLAVSEEDAKGLRLLAPERGRDIVAVPIGVDTDFFHMMPRDHASKALVSIGTMYWPPNVDSMLYFVSDIYPKIRVMLPETTLKIVGARPVSSIVALGEADKSVEVTGFVPDVRPYAVDCGVFIVPLRSGSGMRVKILNALSMGLPVVSTTVGAEGIEVTHGKDILLADTPEDFANAVVSLLRDPAYGARLGEAGRQLIEARYSWQVVGARLRELLLARFPVREMVAR